MCRVFVALRATNPSMDALPANRSWQPSCSHGIYQHEAITSRSRQLLMMGTWWPETCWATIRREIKNTKSVVKSRWQVAIDALSQLCLNLSAPDYIKLILAHPVYKMWIIQEPNTLELWNNLHFEEKEKNGDYIPCLKYSVPIFVE
jgi:hypothetical protein